MSNRRMSLALVVLLGLAVSACGAGTEAGTGASTAPQVTSVAPAATAATATAAVPVTAATSAPAAAVPATLAFTATTVDGKSFDGASVAGKPVVLWFWAAWCPRCMAASAGVASVHRDFGTSVAVLGVAGLNSGESAMRDFVREWKIGGFTNLADDDGVIWRKFGVTTQEYFVLLDKAGTVVHKGPLSGSALRERVSALTG